MPCVCQVIQDTQLQLKHRSVGRSHHGAQDIPVAIVGDHGPATGGPKQIGKLDRGLRLKLAPRWPLVVFHQDHTDGNEPNGRGQRIRVPA